MDFYRDAIHCIVNKRYHWAADSMLKCVQYRAETVEEREMIVNSVTKELQAAHSHHLSLHDGEITREDDVRIAEMTYNEICQRLILGRLNTNVSTR